MTRIVMTWSFTVAVLLLAAFLSKTSEIYSRGWTVAWIIYRRVFVGPYVRRLRLAILSVNRRRPGLAGIAPFVSLLGNLLIIPDHRKGAARMEPDSRFVPVLSRVMKFHVP